MRINFLKFLFLVSLLGVVGRLFFWQIVMGDEFKASAENQHFESVSLPAIRGQIRSSDSFALAGSKPTFLLFGLPQTLSDKEKVEISMILSRILAPEKDQEEDFKKDFLTKLSKNLYWVSLLKNINPDTKLKIQSLKLKGIGFEESTSRFYPEGSSSAHLLGFVGLNQRGEDQGYFGVEGFYNGELKGVSGQIRQERDAFGLPIFFGKFLGNSGRNGKTLELNLDRSVQFITERTLKISLEKYGAKAASAVVIDPKTGAIIAMASYPNYNPLDYSQFPKEFYRNPVVADQYEPGSTFKVFVMSAAMNEDLVKPDTTCDACSGPIALGGFNLRTWDNKYFPNTSMTDVIIHSDNTGMVFVSKKLGLDKFYQYFQNFGFGKPTGIDLQDEFSPELRPKTDWKEIDLATASFGQGIAITPIQMVMAVSAIANGGYLMEPHIVKRIIDENGSTFEIKPKQVRQVLKENTTKLMTEMMVKAVEEGEAKFARPKGFKVAGKTGTAQIPVAGHYDSDKTIASFVGFAPADSPRFVMLVRFDQPSSSIFGAETAAPTFFEIAKQLFMYYKIPPTE